MLHDVVVCKGRLEDARDVGCVGEGDGVEGEGHCLKGVRGGKSGILRVWVEGDEGGGCEDGGFTWWANLMYESSRLSRENFSASLSKHGAF